MIAFISVYGLQTIFFIFEYRLYINTTQHIHIMMSNSGVFSLTGHPGYSRAVSVWGRGPRPGERPHAVFLAFEAEKNSTRSDREWTILLMDKILHHQGWWLSHYF